MLRPQPSSLAARHRLARPSSTPRRPSLRPRRDILLAPHSRAPAAPDLCTAPFAKLSLARHGVGGSAIPNPRRISCCRSLAYTKSLVLTRHKCQALTPLSHRPASAPLHWRNCPLRNPSARPLEARAAHRRCSDTSLNCVPSRGLRCQERERPPPPSPPLPSASPGYTPTGVGGLCDKPLHSPPVRTAVRHAPRMLSHTHAAPPPPRRPNSGSSLCTCRELRHVVAASVWRM